MEVLTCVNKLGRGTYGEVYSAKFVKPRLKIDIPSSEEELYAVKRNFNDTVLSGLGSLRELDFLVALKGHPCIVEISQISIGNPFDEKLINKHHKDMKEDKIHFIMELITQNGLDFYLYEKPESIYLAKIIHETWATFKSIENFYDPRISKFKERLTKLVKEPVKTNHVISVIADLEKILSHLEKNLVEIDKLAKTLHHELRDYYHQIKIIICQLLISIEFCHSKGIIHRDIKPSNLLISKGATPQLKLCDFGLSRRVCKSIPSTPRGVTGWYRAPEICCYDPTYQESSDMWSIAATIFEIVSGIPFLGHVEEGDDDSKLFNAILGKMETVNPEEIKNVRRKGNKKIQVTSEATPYLRRTFEEQLKLRKDEIDAFNSESGNYGDFVDLLRCLFKIDPAQRLTATQALQHPFFSYFRGYIDKMRKIYPPVPDILPKIKIIKCMERNWATGIMFSIYNQECEFLKKDSHTESEESVHWYKHCIVFHALRLFDKYLVWAFDNLKLTEKETTKKGRLHNNKECDFIFYACVYMVYKYYSILQAPIFWSSVVPPSLGKKVKELEDFEELMIQKVLKFQVFSPGILEMIDKFNHTTSEDLIRFLLVKYGDNFDFEGTISELYGLLLSKGE